MDGDIYRKMEGNGEGMGEGREGRKRRGEEWEYIKRLP